jgi:hypothetical protein
MPSSGMLHQVALLHSMCQLLVTANVVPSSLILVTLMMEVLQSSETSIQHGITSQMTAVFIVTAMKTSHHT